MSCGNPEAETGDTEQLMPRRRPVRDKSMCGRCKVERAKFTVRSAGYCKTCFPGHLYTRFIKTLYPPLRSGQLDQKAEKGKSSQRALQRPLKQPGGCVIGISGGAGSLTLLDLLLNGSYLGTEAPPTSLQPVQPAREERQVDKSKGEKEHFWDWGVAVHVDFSAVTASAEAGDGVRDRLDQVKAWVEKRGIQWREIKAEEVFDSGLEARLRGVDTREGDSPRLAVNLDLPGLPLSSVHAESSTSSPLTRLQRLYRSIPTASRPALLQTILNHLLSLTARCIPGVQHLLLGETSTRQAQRIISGTALGRGWSLPLELSVAFQNRLRPMKELSYYECAIHCHLNRIPTHNYRSWVSFSGPRSTALERGRGKGGAESIEALTESFIAGLDVSHPSTVHTINRTGEKLVFGGGHQGNTAGEAGTCPVCEMPIDLSPLAWKARTALTSLGKSTIEKLSSRGTDDRLLDGTLQMAPLLCYACLTTLTPNGASKRTRDGMEFDLEIPLWMGQAASERWPVSRTDMRETIASFLLDGGDNG